MKKTVKKLSLSRETLQRLDVRGGGARPVDPANPGGPVIFDSCAQSCYFVSCGDRTCTASTCEKTQ